MFYHALYHSPIGDLRIVTDDSALLQLWLPNEVASRQPLNEWVNDAKHPYIQLVINVLDRYFQGERLDFKEINCQPVGTDFQRKVWQQLKTIPYASVISYGDIAQALDNPNAVRAIGGAVGANPIAIVLPCHRVLGKTRTLTGYSGGLTVKKNLLDLEHIEYKP